MARYAWIIDKDHFDSEDDGLIGPHNPSSESATLERKNVGERFRMLDDDRNLMYSGRIIGNYGGFEPLDDLGIPNGGCTIIQYRHHGKWEDL